MEPYPFHTKVRVRFDEIDSQGHVYFAQYLKFFDIAALEYMRSIDYSYAQMMDEGVDMLYVDAHVTYQSPSYYDEFLRLHCQIGKVGNTSMRFDFQIFGDEDDRLVAAGEITVVFADPGTWQKVPVPDRVRQAGGS
jgi:acyl-CoA thioester hydrolase